MTLLNMSSDTNTNKDYIPKYMRMFMNNRIGTYLKDSESANIMNIINPRFKRGELVVARVGFNVYKWVTFLEADRTNPAIRNRVFVYTKTNPDDKDIIKLSIPVGNLRKFNNTVPIVQNFNSKKSNLNEEALLETYRIN